MYVLIYIVYCIFFCVCVEDAKIIRNIGNVYYFIVILFTFCAFIVRIS